MRISLEWLSQYLTDPVDPAVAAASLTHAGLPVENIETFGPDTVLDVEVTSNRADCLSYWGVAAELSALLRNPLRPITSHPPEAPTSTADAISVALEAPGLCPHYVARVLTNVKAAPSPPWLVRRLEAMGTDRKSVRGINNIVDVTNYVLFELGQPLHAFDLDKLEGGRIVVRLARPGEKLLTLDGKQRDLTPDMLVIADAVRPVALAGVMGGLPTEVTSSTRNILLESARFDPLSIRRTARALGMASDSSYRFERGIEPTLPERASLRAAELILQTAGGELLRGPVEAGNPDRQPRRLFLRLDRLRRVLGVEIPRERVLDALTRLRLQPALADNRVDVTVPSNRLDLNVEIDLIEEVARVVGYDTVPVREEIAIRLAPPDPAAKALARIHQTITAGGYFEAVTFSFVSDLLATDFVPPTRSPQPLPHVDPVVRRADGSLRPSLLPGLLEAVRRNHAAGVHDAHLYEIGSVFWNDDDSKLQERRRIALVGGTDLRALRGVIDATLAALDPRRAIAVHPDHAPGYARGASGPNRVGRPNHRLSRKDRSRRRPKALARKIPPPPPSWIFPRSLPAPSSCRR